MTVPRHVKRARWETIVRTLPRSERGYMPPISLVSPSLHARITARGMEPNATKRHVVIRSLAKGERGMTIDQAHDLLRGTVRQLERAGFEVIGNVYGDAMVVQPEPYEERGIRTR